jgi:two-component system, cell cycle sensor histidine kinase and response regulator CckA
LQRPVSLDIAMTPANGTGFVAEVDSSQMQQALVNLAHNARDATPDGSSIVFRLHRSVIEQSTPGFPDAVPPGDYVVLEVADNGAGMTPEVLNQALDPFFTTKDVGQGTGLGLPVVFGIVHAHQGFLTIETAPEKGTAVAIYLPRWQERMATAKPASGTREPASGS